MNIVRPYLTPEQAEEKNNIALDCYKLGVILLFYQVLTRAMRFLFYLAAYTYYNGTLTLNVNSAIKYLQDHDDVTASTAFRMSGNIGVTFSSVVLTAVLAHILFKGRIGPWIKPSKERFAAGVLWSAPNYVVGMVATMLTSYLVGILNNSGIAVPTSDFSIVQPSKAAVLLQIGYVIIAAPIIEEYLYRCLILNAVAPYSKSAAVLLSALCFGLMHGNIPQAAGAFVSGLLYAVIAIKTGSIIPTIIIHSFNNLIAELYSLTSAVGLSGADDVIGIFYVLTAFAGLLMGLLMIKRLWFKEDKAPLSAKQVRATVFSNPLILVCIGWYVLTIMTGLLDANS
ncbi:MAG: CPBP family intramembrane metalloprotease [Ruminococcus sp.]|nr:CPBP family intramembrane metalloprotease [Ruminococcus sp.]